ncbi:hypothetical protein FNQ90_17760 [Streptomyces alkaliphilus]|uniref:Barstar (barnase inhibitor) domain-containing protein n=1 Tax=Streptomyces alkaliphilus TaxID=1472722 RepID=A0A7W3Y2L5_9ACTN|nr:barstar family protein [Streptomyces alkaliphilus]MBB0245904.1 hypothetical protein [Streptomyces alkaliphilus]
MTTPSTLPEPFGAGLTALLRGDLPADLYRLPPLPEDDGEPALPTGVRHGAEETGWRVLPFRPPAGGSGGGTGEAGATDPEGPEGTKQLLLGEFAAAFDFPSGTGRNWDALSDLLTDLSWLPPARGRLMVAPTWSGWRACDAGTVDTAEEILREAVAYWSARPVPFAALLG